MLKSVAEAKKALEKLYHRLWAEEAAGCSDKEWPQFVSLGRCSKKELEEHFVAVCAVSDELYAAAVSMGCTVESTTRIVGGTRQNLPTHFVVDDMQMLAVITGNEREYARALDRARRLKRDFIHVNVADLARLLRKMQQVVPDDIDFDLACKAGVWFAENHVQGLTPRQVPLAGFHAKWLEKQGRSTVVAQLAGLDELHLEQRPPLVRFTYLDPSYLHSGGRRFDSWVVGDAWALPYEPQVVIICENRDTALWFPEVEHGVAVMGDGKAAIHNLPALDWVRNAPILVYWGDMDASGFEILAGCRQVGLECVSIFMDLPAFEKYEKFGTKVDKRGNELPCQDLRMLQGLQDKERELYLRLIDPEWKGPRRIEQERIPLEAALREIRKLQY